MGWRTAIAAVALGVAQSLGPATVAAATPSQDPYPPLADCDETCLATGAWALGLPGMSSDGTAGVGEIVSETDGTWTIDVEGRDYSVTPQSGAQVWVPSLGLSGVDGLAPKLPIEGEAPIPGIDRWWTQGQAVRVSGGEPGASWTGDVQLRMNWWDGSPAFAYRSAAGARTAGPGALAGRVVHADNEGVTVDIAGHVVWLAAYPDTDIPQMFDRVTYDIADAVSTADDGRAYDPGRLKPGDPIFAWFDRDLFSATNPRMMPLVDPATSCPVQAGTPGCRWEAMRIYLQPGSLSSEARPWWEMGQYAWSNVNPSFGVGDVRARCMFTSEAAGVVVAVDPGHMVQVLADGVPVTMEQPIAEPVPLIGELARLHGGGCIANGSIERPGSIEIAPRSATRLAGVVASSHRLALTVDPPVAELSESRLVAGASYQIPVTRVRVIATLDDSGISPVDAELALVSSDDGWLEASAPGTLTVSEAERRTLVAGDPIDPWSVRILRRPPPGETRDITLTAFFVERGSGVLATATATVRLVGGAYPQPTAAQAGTSAVLAGAQQDGVPDGAMVSVGGGTVELTVRPDGLASGGGVFNYKGFSCDSRDFCSEDPLSVDLAQRAGVGLPDVVSVTSQGPSAVAVTMSVSKGAVTWLYRHRAVIAGERWAGAGLSLAGMVYDSLGITKVCGTASIKETQKPGRGTGGILAFLRDVGLDVACELPDFGLQYMSLATDDPLAASPGAYGIGTFADLSFGFSAGVRAPDPVAKGFDLISAVRVFRLDGCSGAAPGATGAQTPVLLIPYGESARATSRADPCVAQLDPDAMARILAKVATDPSAGGLLFPTPRAALAWLVAADPVNAVALSAAFESVVPRMDPVTP